MVVDRRRRRTAQAIKQCLENLAEEARSEQMIELAHMIGVAALTADEAGRGREELPVQLAG